VNPLATGEVVWSTGAEMVGRGGLGEGSVLLRDDQVWRRRSGGPSKLR
jgi:hypothetical protein